VQRAAARQTRPVSSEPDELQVVYTDGACIRNPGKGGWAWAMAEDCYESGFEPDTTNQRMELRAALEAIRTIEGSLKVVSDSTYLVNCFRDRWYTRWRVRGWRNSKGEPVANQELWRPLVHEVVESRRRIEFQWVKGHAADPMNTFVDHLANEAARGQRAAAGTALPPVRHRAAGGDWEQGRLLP
jgi:ribonuclease HI